MKNRRNYYRILHVGPDAPPAIIHASYRALMQRLRMHPDLGGDHTQAALINEAYATLSDPDKRAAYDLTLKRVSEQRRGGSPASASPAASVANPPRPASPITPACSFCGAPFHPAQAAARDAMCVRCDSPLTPAPQRELSDLSRRHLERMPRSMPVTFWLASSRDIARTGTTEDLSPNGMRVRSSISVPIGERVKIDCSFCSAVAIVKSARRDEVRGRGWQCGVEFMTLRIKHERGGFVSTTA